MYFALLREVGRVAGRQAVQGTWPPPAKGRGRGPPETSSRKAGTQDTVGGAGVSVANGVPLHCLPSGARSPAADVSPHKGEYSLERKLLSHRELRKVPCPKWSREKTSTC